MHFDDGMDEIITLPDDTVRLTGEAVVAAVQVCQMWLHAAAVASPTISLLCLREHPRAAGWGCGWS